MTASLENLNVIVAGAGIGGLASALALARCGARVAIYERRANCVEEGAGIQIGPNGVRVLEALGVAERLRPHVGVPQEIIARDGHAGDMIAQLPLGSWMAQRHGTPYWVAHRADLHAALRDTVDSQPNVCVHSGVEIDGVELRGDEVEARSGGTVLGASDILVAADGLHSKIRDMRFSSARPQHAGLSASRAVIPIADVPAGLESDNVGIWLSPIGHVVHYPVRAGLELAIVVIRHGRRDLDGWGNEVSGDDVRASVTAFAAPLRQLVGAAETWRAWSLFEMPVPKSLAGGRVVLLGDAAHPVLPFLAQGAVMALEDSVVLADALCKHQGADGALAVYDRARGVRVRRVQSASKRNGRIYHVGGPLALARNTVMRMSSPERLMAQYDWLYGWRL